MSHPTDPLVAVLMGGLSAEREVSLSSGQECAVALRTAGFRVVEIDAQRDLAARLSELRPDVAFNALHGRWGEDGCVQGLLEWMGIPYTHSGVLASAVAMDKQRSKMVYAEAGLPIVTSHIVPAVYIVHEAANGPPQLDDDMPETVMVERFAPGRELTTTVMGDKALAVTDIVTEGWYDYDAKYKPGGSSHILPAEVPAEISAACMDYALRAHQALGCRGVSRTDYRWDESRGLDGLILLETNTQPGMTPTSLVPEQAALCGIPFPELCRWMVEDASCGR